MILGGESIDEPTKEYLVYKMNGEACASFGLLADPETVVRLN
jgi:hypothetical protein